MSTLSAKEYKCFEDIKRIRPDGSEYWAARELAPVLDYAKWENFYKVIKRAMIACENSGRSTLECFPEVRKTSPMPNGGVKDILDYELSRYACYRPLLWNLGFAITDRSCSRHTRSDSRRRANEEPMKLRNFRERS